MNAKLFAYLNSEQNALWIEKHGDVIHIIAKSTLPVIKSLWSGAPIELIIGAMTEENILVLGLVIEDNPENPFLIMYPPRENEEIRGLDRLLSGEYKKIKMSFFDAHTIRVMDMTVRIADRKDDDRISGLTQINKYSLISNYRDGQTAMNYFTEKVFDVKNENGILKFPLYVEDKHAYHAIVYEPNNTKLEYEFHVSRDGSEGYDQESLVYHSLRQLFSADEVFKSPVVEEGKKDRELVDVLVVEGDHILSIQSKASSLIEIGLKTHKKLNSMYKKKTLQGIDQVKGVIPIFDNDVILKQEGRNHHVRKSDEVYHLVIITDLVINEEDDKVIHAETNKLYNKKGAKIMVMSLDGLANFVKFSRLHKKLFWMNIKTRFNFAMRNKTIRIHDIDSSMEHNLPLLAPENYIKKINSE